MQRILHIFSCNIKFSPWNRRDFTYVLWEDVQTCWFVISVSPHPKKKWVLLYNLKQCSPKTLGSSRDSAPWSWCKHKVSRWSFSGRWDREKMSEHEHTCSHAVHWPGLVIVFNGDSPTKFCGALESPQTQLSPDVRTRHERGLIKRHRNKRPLAFGAPMLPSPSVLDFELRVSSLLSMCSTTQVTPPALFCYGYFLGMVSLLAHSPDQPEP
jgi:hypothetical protein